MFPNRIIKVTDNPDNSKQFVYYKCNPLKCNPSVRTVFLLL